MTGVDIYNFIKPHLGSIEGCGSHEVDVERISNFNIRGELINCLLEDLESSYLNSKDAYQKSIKDINNKSISEINKIHYFLTDYVVDYLQETQQKGEN